jgi:predicted ribosome quality control (RQC) complex YloA/Tae2 family protein
VDYHTIAAHRALLERELIGQRIETVRLREFTTLFIGFEGETALKLACIPDMPYLHTMEKRFMPHRNAQNWHLAKFAGSRLAGITQSPGDRVLAFTAESGTSIIFEMTGRNANIIVVGPEGLIAGATRLVTGRESGFRIIRPGVPYAPPPARDFHDLETMPFERFLSLAASRGGAALESLAALLSGSRLFAREVLARCGIAPDSEARSIMYEDARRLLETALVMMRSIRSGGEGGTVVMDERDGLPRDVFPLPMASASERDRFFGDLSEAVIAYARDRERALERRGLLASVITALAREERSIRDTNRKIERERGDESGPEMLERRATGILAGLRLLKKGMTSAVLPDPYGEGDIEVELDPALDGPANANRLFTRARKLRSAARIAVERIGMLERRLDDIRKEREALASIEDIHPLREMAARYSRRAQRSRELDITEQFPRRFTSVSGLEIIVGRNDAENDGLISWARRSDVWLHAQGVGGSHVILRSPGRQTPDHRSIEQAAAIAAYYSKARTSAIVPVVWTLLKYVVKRKGQGPGQVTYTREKVVFVEPCSSKEERKETQ